MHLKNINFFRNEFMYRAYRMTYQTTFCILIFLIVGCANGRKIETNQAVSTPIADSESKAAPSSDSESRRESQQDQLPVLPQIADSESTVEFQRDLFPTPTSVILRKGPNYWVEQRRHVDAGFEKQLCDGFVGLSETEARLLAGNQGREFRVASRDWRPFPLTTDIHPGRVTAVVNNGVVTRVNIE
jgi:hypothetical protein